MSKKDEVFELMKKNNGIITSQYAKSMGVNNKVLQRMEKSGLLVRVARGLYIDANQMENEYYIAQYRCKRCIFSHETALYLHDLADRTPLKLTLTIPSGYNTRMLKENDKYEFHYVSEKLHSIGITRIDSPFGHKLDVYNKERTIIDCIKKKSQLDIEIVTVALKEYFNLKDVNYTKLLRYAEIFNVKDAVRNYMEVLV
jgi:predicted transcriptional regulator of viral defense system